MSDYAHRLTDEEIGKLIEQISAIYSDAYEKMIDTCKEYWDKLSERETKMLKDLEKGKITKQEFDTWRNAQIGRGSNIEAIKLNIADVLGIAKEEAAEIINDKFPDVYALNRNWQSYMIEEAYKDDLSVTFSLIDRDTINRLLIEHPDLMPYYDETFPMAMVRGLTDADIAWAKGKITSAVTSGLIRGTDVKTMAKDIMEMITRMEESSAIRAARTAMTSAESAGRQDSYYEATQMGLTIRKEWLATKDRRTRASHGSLDGKRVKWDEKFPNGLLYPADPTGRPEEVYNCRCTMFAVLPETEKDRRITYKQWLKKQRGK